MSPRPLSTQFRTLNAVLALTAALSGALVSADEEHDGHQHQEPQSEGRSFSVEDFERAGVRLTTAGPGEVDLGIELPGEVRPNADRIAHIAPRFAGLVREVRKRIGDTVKAGDVLAIIESENLSPFELRAAFDGTVIDKHIAPGEAVRREEAAFIVADLTSVWVMVSVYQNALAQVQTGQPVRVVASQGGIEAEGRVSYVSPVVDQATRTATARVVLPNPDGAWRPGLFVTAIVLNPVAALIVIPRRAVQTYEARPTVFVADQDHFAPRVVELGRVGRTRVEVTAGLASGERVADERSFLVKADLAKGEAAHED
jgi:cobalt-zinc-cadmium efflux system membrane fusion protein